MPDKTTDKKKPEFKRRDWYKKSKLGLHRKKKQVWRRPKGRHSKTRQRWKCRGKRPSVGYGAAKEERGKISGLRPVLIHNVSNVLKLKKDEIGIMGKGIGVLKKEAIAKKTIELGIKFTNFNAQEFLNKLAGERAEKAAEKKEGKKEKEEAKKAEGKAKEEEKAGEKKEEEKKEKTGEEKEEEIKEEKKEEEKILHKEMPKAKPEMTEAKKAHVRRLALEK